VASTYTTNLTLEKPGIGEQDGDWGTTLNSNFDTIDTKLAIKDEDDMSSDSASHLSTQQSIKAYVDSQVNTEETIEDFVGGMVTGNTETGIAVTYEDSDGTLDFVVADTTVAGDSGSTGMTPGDTLTIAGGTNVTTAMSGDTLTVTSTDTNTQLTQEQVEDYVGGMLDGDETFIAVSYDDTDGNIDFTVPVKDEDNMASDSATYLATQQSIKAYVDDNLGTVALSNIDIDGGTDIGEAIVDADLFIVDNGAGGTNRKTQVSRLKTYVQDAGTILQVVQNTTVGQSTTSSTSAVDITNFTVNITPASVSNYVIVMISCLQQYSLVASTNVAYWHKFLGGNLGVTDKLIAGVPWAGLTVASGSGGLQATGSYAWIGMDNPESTSEQTYKVQHYVTSASSTAYAYYGQLVCMEVQV